MNKLDIVDELPGVAVFMGKKIGEGNTQITTCDGIHRDLISIEQPGDSGEDDIILLFGRDQVEGLRDALTLHLERIDIWKNGGEHD